jgi:hypothetical protein
VAGWPPERAAEVCGVDAGRIREAARILGEGRAAAVHRPPGRLPVQPGDRGRLPGQQPQPAPGDDRAARLRGAADERPADGREHPRVRRRRRPPRVPQLAQPGPRRRAGRALERRPHDHPALGAPDPRHADLALRRAGVDQAAVDLGHQPGRVPARAGPGPGHPGGPRAVRGRPGRLPDRDGPPRRRGPAGRPVGREAGMPARGGGPATTPGSATTGCATPAGSSGRAPPTPPAGPSGCMPTGASRPTPRCARTTATTWPPGPS